MICVLAFIYLMNTVRYLKFRYQEGKLLLIVTRINGDTVTGRATNHPMNPGSTFGLLMGVPVEGHTRCMVLVILHAYKIMFVFMVCLCT